MPALIDYGLIIFTPDTPKAARLKLEMHSFDPFNLAWGAQNGDFCHLR